MEIIYNNTLKKVGIELNVELILFRTGNNRTEEVY